MKDMSEEKEGNVVPIIKKWLETHDNGSHFPTAVRMLMEDHKSLESRLKEAERNLELEKMCKICTTVDCHHHPLDPKQTLINDLRKRLSQAEAENKRLKQERDDNEYFHASRTANSLIAACRVENQRQAKRLSHLMDVGGKMAGALEHIVNESETSYFEEAKLAIAEWDGIKKEDA